MKKSNNIKEVIYTGLFASLIGVGAYITIPTPIIPLTLQVFFVLLSGAILGKKWGSLSVIIYLIMGLIGLPVFSGGGSGFSYIFTPSFGYILGFILCSYITGYILEFFKEKSFKNIFIAGFVGIIVIHLIGGVYLYFITNYYLNSPVEISYVLINCFLLTLPADLIKLFLCSYLGARLLKLSIFREIIFEE